MNIRNVTVIFSGGQEERGVLSYADGFCKDIGIRANCLYASPEVESVVRTAFAGSANLIMHDKYFDTIKEDLKARGQHAKREFDSLSCENLDWASETGNPKETAAYFGKFSDLLILNKDIGDAPEYNDVVSSAIFETGGPIILYPKTFQYKGINNVLIAWDGSARVARAVKSSIDLLKKANIVEILTIDETQKDISSIKDLMSYLGSHEVRSTHVNISKISRCVGDEILNEAKRRDADMIIMGAFTHNKMHQIVFGGATKYILSNTTVPVLMEH